MVGFFRGRIAALSTVKIPQWLGWCLRGVADFEREETFPAGRGGSPARSGERTLEKGQANHGRDF